MSGRTCQFCGKPLWRIRRGEGEFCSREHRNQFQLRRGLTQLAEGEKMATLRRKQDQVAITSLQRPAGPAALEARRSFVWKGMGTQRPANAVLPQVRPANRTRLTEMTPAALQPRGRAASVARRSASALGITRLRAEVSLPASRSQARISRQRVADHIQTPPAPAHPGPRRVVCRPRLATALLRIGRAPAAPRPSIAPLPRVAGAALGTPLSVLQPAATALGNARSQTGMRTRLLCHAGAAALRNPLIPPIQPAAYSFDLPLGSHAPMVSDAIAPLSSQRALSGAWAPAQFQFSTLEEKWLVVLTGGALRDSGWRTLELPRQTGVVRRMPARVRRANRQPDLSRLHSGLVKGQCKLPVPRFRSEGARPQYGALLGRLCSHFEMQVPGPRCSMLPRLAGNLAMPERTRTTLRIQPKRSPYIHAYDASLVPSAPAADLALRHYLDHAAGPGVLLTNALSGPGSRSVPQQPRGIVLDLRTVEIPFAAREVFFEPPQMAIHGDMESVLQAEAGAPLRLEEHFSSGMQDWTGGAADWKVDLAGVRVGGTSFYTPTQGLHDYEIEFLARVEKGSLICLCRAADPQNHCAVEIVLADPSRLELHRYAVIGGVAEDRVITPLASKPKTALTLLLRMNGSSYTVLVDGQEVAQWTETRLSPGAVGFQTKTGDRARLYWLRVTATVSFEATEKRNL